MISVDTNIVVRFLTGDDYSQFERAKKLFREKEIFIPLTVILECEWVLKYAFDILPSLKKGDSYQLYPKIG